MGFIANIVHLFLVLLLQLIFQAKFSETKVNFTGDLLPYLYTYTPINSSAIEIVWHPSSTAANNTDLTQLSGTIDASVYAGHQLSSHSATMTYPVAKLNETGKIVLAGLQADTIYSVQFQQTWKDDSTVNSYTRGISSKLVRTYTTNETKLNSIPPVGEYKWNQILTNAGEAAVIVNASISLELPYTTRTINATFGSENQSRTLGSSEEFIAFQFNLTDQQRKDYPLTVTFIVLDETGSPIFGKETTTYTRKETVQVTPPSKSVGSKLAMFTIFYPIISTMIFFI